MEGLTPATPDQARKICRVAGGFGLSHGINPTIFVRNERFDMTDRADTNTQTLCGATPVVDVHTLLGPDGRAFLRYDGTVYTLRVTRNDKLILTK